MPELFCPIRFRETPNNFLSVIATVKGQVELSDQAVSRVEHWLSENAQLTHDQADRVVSLIAVKRFLVGNSLAGTFEEYLEAIHTTFRELAPSAEGLRAYRDAYARLKRLRTDVESTSKEVFG